MRRERDRVWGLGRGERESWCETHTCACMCGGGGRERVCLCETHIHAHIYLYIIKGKIPPLSWVKERGRVKREGKTRGEEGDN